MREWVSRKASESDAAPHYECWAVDCFGSAALPVEALAVFSAADSASLHSFLQK